MTSNRSRQLHLNGIQHPLPPKCPELVLRACPRYFYTLNHAVHSAHPLTESQTGLPDWDLKMKCPGSCCVSLKVCTSPEPPPAKSREHRGVALPPEPMPSFSLFDCSMCPFFFTSIPLAFVSVWHRTHRTLRKLLLPIKLFFLNLCSSS